MEKRSIRLQEIMAAVLSVFFIRFLSGGGCSGHRLFFHLAGLWARLLFFQPQQKVTEKPESRMKRLTTQIAKI